MESDDTALPASAYTVLLEELKTRIANAQVQAALAVNRELVLLYWQIGPTILLQQRHQVRLTLENMYRDLFSVLLADTTPEPITNIPTPSLPESTDV